MDTNKRNFEELSSPGEQVSPLQKRHEASGEASGQSNMAPSWFTHSMAEINHKLSSLGNIQSQIYGITDSLTFISDEVTDAKNNSIAALQKSRN